MQRWVPPEIERAKIERKRVGLFWVFASIVMGAVLAIIAGLVGGLIGDLVFVVGVVVVILSLVLFGKYELAGHWARSSRQEATSATSGTKFCVHCRRPIYTDSEFCEYCGNRVQ